MSFSSKKQSENMVIVTVMVTLTVMVTVTVTVMVTMYHQKSHPPPKRSVPALFILFHPHNYRLSNTKKNARFKIKIHGEKWMLRIL